MAKFQNQEERINFLLKELIAESDELKNIEVPINIIERDRLLRSIMNIRMPKPISNEVIEVQDEYLSTCANEKGIVSLADITLIDDNIAIWQGDITRLKVDVIVNAANSQMLGCFLPMHTCIDNQIHTFAGIQLREECNVHVEKLKKDFGRNYEQPTAVPMLTDAYNLPAKKVVHIVGPIVEGTLTEKLEHDLRECYTNTLDLCLEYGLKSVAFCCISTGVFRFPAKRAAQIAVETVKEWISRNQGLMERIIFNVFKDEDRRYYEELLC